MIQVLGRRTPGAAAKILDVAFSYREEIDDV